MRVTQASIAIQQPESNATAKPADEQTKAETVRQSGDGIHVSISSQAREKLNLSKAADAAEDKPKDPPHIASIKKQIERLKEQIEEIKQKMRELEANGSLDEESKRQQMEALQSQLASLQGALNDTTASLVEAMEKQNQ